VNETGGIAHSVHVRLVARAKEMGIEAQLLLKRYALHRLLCRLSRSEYAERFLLKGAQLMLVWMGESARPTRDADLLGFGDLSEEALQQVFEAVCAMQMDDDGLAYLPESIRVRAIRGQDAYGGYRVSLDARLGNARLRLQPDVGIGDAVPEQPAWVELPAFLELPPVRLRAYYRETSIAETLETIVSLGLLNSRLKDYFDLYMLAQRMGFDGGALTDTVRRTFERRGTPIPAQSPPGLTRAFADEPGKQLQWVSFCRKAGEPSVPEDLVSVIGRIAAFLVPVLRSAGQDDRLDRRWPPGGPWTAQRRMAGLP